MHAIVEMMGHRKFGAKIEERELAGVKLLHCTVLAPEGDGALGEQFVNASSLYALTPCGEEIARKANANTWQVRAAVPSLPSPVVEARADDIPVHEEDPDAEDDESPRTPVGLAIWLEEVVEDFGEHARNIEGMTERQRESTRHLILAIQDVVGVLSGASPVRGAPFGGDTVGSGANDEDDEPEYQWSPENPPDVDTVMMTLVLVDDFGTLDSGSSSAPPKVDPAGEARLRAAVEAWDPMQRFQSWRWAACEHVAAADHDDARRWPEPACVKKLREATRAP